MMGKEWVYNKTKDTRAICKLTILYQNSLKRKHALEVTYPVWLDIAVLRSCEVLKVKNNKTTTDRVHPHNIGKGGLRDLHPNNAGS